MAEVKDVRCEVEGEEEEEGCWPERRELSMVEMIRFVSSKSRLA